MAYGFTKEKLYDLHYGQDLTTVEISRMYGCHRDTVCLALKRFGIVPRGQIKKDIPHELAFKLADMYINQKMSTRKIGKILNLDHSTVSRKLKEIGIEVEPKEVVTASDRHPNWNGGKTLSKYGYIEVTKFRKFEHVIIMETFLGRTLKSNEVVHHIDGDKTNNKIDNLAIMDISAHTRLHLLERWKKDA